MIQVGSRVKFLHSTGIGIVRSIKNNIANVDVDGFEIPALLSDIVEVPIDEENAAIVKIGPSQDKPRGGGVPQARVNQGQQYGRITIAEDYEDDEVVDVNRLKSQYAKRVESNIITNQPILKPVIEKAPYEYKDYNVKLAFVPHCGGKPEAADLDMYLINDSSYELYFAVAQWKNGYVETISHGRLEADTREMLRSFPRTFFSQIQNLHISLLPFKPINYTPQVVENFDLELHPLKFIRSGNYAENDYFDERSFIFSLSGDDILAPQEVRAVPESKKEKTQPQKHEGTQVEDLHIEELTEGWQELSGGEILATQLARFNIVMESAIRSRQRGKIVFIHGVGKGKLKYELKKVLDKQYSKFRYQDASFKEYGYGAIMVYL